MKSKTVNFLFIFIVILENYGISCQDFGYDGTEGPNYWKYKYSQCVGKHQSPIDIESEKVVIKKFPPLVLKHFDKKIDKAFLQNNGHTVQLKILSDPKPELKGGPLMGVFEFGQLHYHWGENDTVGSENQVNHQSFTGEMHLVFFDKKYKDLNVAANMPSGLTVLSFFIIISDYDNEGYDKFEDGLKDVIDLSANRTLYNLDSLDNLTRPKTKRSSYYTYEGSLTTPPCSEVVTWIEFTSGIPMSKDQINAFRKLFSKHGYLTHNYRPVQPLNDRIVYYNEAKNRAEKTKFSMLYFTLVILIGQVCNNFWILD